MSHQERTAHRSAEELEAARADLRRAISRAVSAGIGWQEIIRVIAEKGPMEEPAPLPTPSAKR